MSECLQYPDFSVVVLYKKVIIAFGFMVPDVKYNEAYISFLLVHPEWRRAGIATFMIYHLIQVMKSSCESAKEPALPSSLCAHMQILESRNTLCEWLWEEVASALEVKMYLGKQPSWSCPQNQ